MKPPPRHYPRDLSKQFAADPFDRRMHRGGPDRSHTPLGLLVELWHWYETHKADVGPAFAPMARSIRSLLEAECPDALKELEEMSERV